jgi:hypothetical protein
LLVPLGVPRINWLYAVRYLLLIIHLNGCLYSFCFHGVFIMKMKFAVNLDNNKVVDNLLIYLVLNFHSYRPNDLRVIAI